MSISDLIFRARMAVNEAKHRVRGGATQTANRTLDLDELEERVLLSATPMAQAFAPDDVAAQVAVMDVETSDESLADATDNQDVAESFERRDGESTEIDAQVWSGQSPNLQTQTRHELVFVNRDVDDYQQLVDDIVSQSEDGTQVELFVLDDERDGVQQISEVLDRYTGLDAVHVLSHGTDGHVKLGGTWLSNDNLGGYAGQFAKWGWSFGSDADILFYGCDLASNSDGQQLVQTLSTLTGADVAASIDDTGAAAAGGDWDLEFQVGQVESALAVSAAAQEEWAGILSGTPPTVTTTAGTLAYTEGDGKVLVDSGVTVTDVEDTNLASATVRIVSGFTSGEDVLSFTDQNGITGLYDSGTGVLSLTGSATVAEYEIALRSVEYENANINPNTVNRIFSFEANDGTGNGSASRFVSVASVGDLTTDTTTDTLDGDTANVSALLADKGADGAISLREAIIATNNTAGADSFTLASGTYALTRTGSGEDVASTGDLDVLDTLTITGTGASNTIINGNAADRIFHLLSGSTLTVSGATLQNGSIDNGGAVLVNSNATLTLNQVLVTSNSATTDGGAISSDGTLSLTDVRLTNNTAPQGGGLNNSGMATLSRVTIDGNTAFNIGGGINNTGAGTTLSLTNATISGNNAASNGGGIYTNQTIDVTNSTIFNNTSAAGGGINAQGSGDANLKNSILASNSGGNANRVLTSLGGNIDSGNTVGLVEPSDQINTNPNLNPALVDNGGFTPTHALLAGSAAIDSGVIAGAPTTDQRGITRDATPDVGAYEFTGQLLAYESFDYPTGSLNGANGGTGWTTAWTTTSGTSANVIGTGLTDPSELLPVAGGTTEMSTTSLFTQSRDLASNLGTDGTSAWFSFLVKPDGIDSGGISLELGTAADDTVTVGTNSNDFLITRNGSPIGASYINDVLVDAQTYFLAFKVDFAAGADTVTLYVDPTPGLSNPDSVLTTQLSTADLGTFTQVGMIGGFLGNNSNIDEIRVGISFGEVAPSNAVNSVPTADAGGPYVISEGDSLNLDGSASSDPDTDPLTFAWDLDNDGNFGEVGEPTTETPTVSWATLQSFSIDDDTGGPYTIGLQVDDGNGGINTTTTTVTVNNTAPVLSTTGSGTVTVANSFTLNLSASDPGADTISSWTINWGDGTIETIAGNPSSTTHTYNAAGFTYNILASATDEDGTYLQNELLVASSNNDRVLRYGPDAAFLQAFATSDGSDFPVDTVIGPDGNLYLSGWNSDNVLRYDATSGAFIDEFVSAGDGGLDSAAGLAFGPDGHLYVASRLTSEVLRFDSSTGAFIDVFVTAGSGGLDQAEGLIFGPDGDLYVSDYMNSAVYKYDGTTGAFDTVFVTAGSGGLNKAEDLTFGPDGNLYVADDSGNSVRRYAGTTGAFIDVFVASGSGGLTSATGVDFGPDGNLYVGSWGTDSVLRYDGTTGAFIDAYIASGSGGLDETDYFTFIPGHQVLVTPAAPLVVDTTDDVVDGDTSSVAALVGSKGADGFISLREAIIATNTDIGADTINLSAGVYQLTLTGTGENAAATGDLDIVDELTITGAGSALTIVDGLGLDKVFEIRGGPTVTIEDLTVQGGNAGSKWGGGVNMEHGGTVQLNRLLIRDSYGASGGGIYNYQGNLTVTDTTLVDNSANYGGGIYNDGGIAVLNRVTINGNHANNDGGGVYAFGTGANTTLTNVTISGNTADVKGGGYATNKTNTLTNVTIAENSAPTAGGIYIANPGSVDLKNSIVAFNTGGNANAAVNSLGNNIDSENTLGFSEAGDQINTDPLIAPLADNGGFTQTHALLSLGGAQQSSAVDAGTVTGAPTVDQRGETRDASVDIGAYESVSGANAPPSITLTNGVINYFANTGTMTIDPGATVLDPDSVNFDTGTLTAGFASGGTANDRLAITDEGTGAGQIGVSGATITFGGTAIASFTGGTDGSTPLVISLSAAASQPATQALLRNITYENILAAPATTSRTLRLVLTDGDGGTSLPAAAKLEIIDSSSNGLWLSSSQGSSNGATGLASWTAGEVIELSDPNLSFETVSNTDGTFSSRFNVDDLVLDGSANVNAIHYVTRNITVGGAGGSVNLQAGDVLLSTLAVENLTSTNALSVQPSDVFAFRPDTAGDYSQGTFFIVLDDPWTDGTSLPGVSLVEQSVTVGDKLLNAGDFLLSRIGGSEQNDIYLFETIDVGDTTTSGTIVKLIEGDDIGITSQVDGIELIESGTSIGNAVLHTGTLLVTLDSGDTVGSTSTSVVGQDVFALSVTQTTAVSGIATAEATIVIEGADVGLSVGTERLDALSLAPDSGPPVANADAYFLNEGATLNEPAFSGVLANDTDPDLDTLTATLVTGPSFASSFALNANGSFDYTHDGSENFTDSFTYEAADGNGGTSTATVSLTITPVNENLPVVVSSQTFNMSESAANMTSVGNVLATDADTGTVFSNWTIVSGNTDSVFAIDSNTGELSVTDNTKLDFEGTIAYALNITVNDGVNTSLAQTVGVDITNENDTPPVITPTQSFIVSEDAMVGTSLGMVIAIDADGATTYSNWEITSGNVGGGFSINSSTGELTVANAGLDFETLPNYTLSLTVSDGVNTSVVETVTVTLTDANDETPVITASQVFGVSESASNGTAVGTVLATDADAGTTFSNWTITSGNTGGAFSINASTGSLQLANGSAIDFESSSNFIITLTVSDGVNTSAAQLVTLTVTDENDETPVVTTSQAFNISESASNGTVVGTVAATDADAGTVFSNWQITAGDPSGAFSIDANTGEIQIADTNAIDFETQTSFGLSVTVSDGVSTSGVETITINVSDSNDNLPVIASSQTFNVSESAPDGTSLGTILATDADTGTTFSAWMITSGNTSGVFAIDANTGELTVADNTNLDFESTIAYALNVSVSDGVNTSLAQTVGVNITNENDSAPIVLAAQGFNVSESASIGTSLGFIAATDPDGATVFSNWLLTGGNVGGAFSIDVNTGELTVANALDLETTPSYSLSVTVSDGVKTSTAEVVAVTLTNTNEAPTDVLLNNMTVAEDQEGAVVGKLSTVDPDASDSHTYAVDDVRFEVVGNQLKLRANESLNFETEPTVSLNVTSTDAGSLSVMRGFVISVMDANDNTPVITPSQSFNVTETAANGTLLGSVLATDSDAGTTFSDWTITSGNISGVFAINATTGELTVLDSTVLDFETMPSYSLGVTVTDGTNTSAVEAVMVSVTNVNESPTAITTGPYVINEGAPVSLDGRLSSDDSAVTSFEWDLDNDGDYGDVGEPVTATASVSWAILDSFGLSDGTFTIGLQVTDVGGLMDSVTTTLTVNNVAPSLTSSETGSVTEGTSLAYTAVASDPADSVTFSLAGGADDGLFTINSVTGDVTFNSAPDFELPADADGDNVYELQVAASDGTAVDSMQVSLSVTDINDSIPVVVIGQQFAVSETATSGTTFGTIIATDADAGTTFSGWTIVSGNASSVFAINSITGELTVLDDYALDFETTPSYSLGITVSDGLNTSTAETVTINVTGENESPTGVSLSNTTVAENSPGATIGALTTTDPDVGDTHTYTVSDARFEVVGNGLKLKDAESLNFELEPTVALTVTATDQAGTGLSHNQAFTLTVTDTNDSPTANPATFSIAENATLGTVVGTVNGTDEDAGDTLTWLITSGDPNGAFAINSSTGEIRVARPLELDFESTPVFNLQVEATDSQGATDVTAITVDLLDQNEAPTIITLTNASVLENNSSAVVGTLVTTDEDTGDAHTYAVSDGRFEIVSNELRLKPNVMLDHETEPTISIVITSTDTGDMMTSQAFVLDVLDSNDAPISISLSSTTVPENQPGALIGSLTVEDADTADAHTLTVSDSRFEIVTDATLGHVLRLRPGQMLNFETERNVSLNVTATDMAGGVFSRPFNITVLDRNEAPSVSLSSINSTLSEDTNTTVSIKLAEVEVTDDALGNNTLTLAGPDATHFEIVNGNAGEELHLRAGTNIDFETQQTYQVLVRVDDATIGTSPDDARLHTLHITNTNELPTAVYDHFVVDEGGLLAVPLTASLLNNDTDPDGDRLAAALVNGPRHAANFQLNADGTFTYRHDGSETTTDSFSYRAVDGHGGTDIAVVQLDVTPINDAPRAFDRTFATDGGAALAKPTGTLSGHDAEGDSLSVLLVHGSSHGQLTLAPDGSFVYTPGDSFAGIDTFVFRVSDGQALSNPAIATIEVVAAPSPTVGQTSATTIERTAERPVIERVPTSNQEPRPERPATVDDSPSRDGDSSAQPTGAEGPVASPAVQATQAVVEDAPASDDEQIAAAPLSTSSGDELIGGPVKGNGSSLSAPELTAHAIEEASRALSEQLARNRSINFNGVSAVDFDSIAMSDSVHFVTQTGNSLYNDLDKMQESVASLSDLQTVVVGTAVTATTSLTVGYVLWTIRGGILASSLLAQMPAWRLVDPLVVLDYIQDFDDDGESLESIIDGSESA